VNPAEIRPDPADRHRPVMLRETRAALAPSAGKVLLDGTLGMGGHAEDWLIATAPDGRVIGFDRDEQALEQARKRLTRFGGRLETHHDDYRNAPQVLAERSPARSVDAVLLDLGIGSHQIDDPQRGFSFRFDAPLDMRYDRSRPGRTAAEIIAQSSEPELAAIFRDYGEEPAAKKIARVIVEERKREAITRTTHLAELVRRHVPARARGKKIDAATRVFQSLRIATNSELANLDQAIVDLARCLEEKGRIAILAFHSLEDRIAKRTLRKLAEKCRCRRGDPCTCGAEEILELPVRKAIKPNDEECETNPRARSARLRWGMKR